MVLTPGHPCHQQLSPCQVEAQKGACADDQTFSGGRHLQTISMCRGGQMGRSSGRVTVYDPMAHIQSSCH